MFVRTDYDGCGYITAGKLYRVLGTVEQPVSKKYFSIITDNGVEIGAATPNCSHLDGHNWEFVEPEEIGPCSIDEVHADLGLDVVNHPPHYTSHPSGIECIQVTEHMSFTIGNAVKYLWRADLKNGLDDLKKAAWYIHREIERREKSNG